MTLRSIILQSDSELDSICNSCDVFLAISKIYLCVPFCQSFSVFWRLSGWTIWQVHLKQNENKQAWWDIIIDIFCDAQRSKKINLVDKVFFGHLICFFYLDETTRSCFHFTSSRVQNNLDRLIKNVFEALRSTWSQNWGQNFATKMSEITKKAKSK